MHNCLADSESEKGGSPAGQQPGVPKHAPPTGLGQAEPQQGRGYSAAAPSSPANGGAVQERVSEGRTLSCTEILAPCNIFRVGQSHTYVREYGVHSLFLAGESTYHLRSCTVQLHSSGQL